MDSFSLLANDKCRTICDGSKCTQILCNRSMRASHQMIDSARAHTHTPKQHRGREREICTKIRDFHRILMCFIIMIYGKMRLFSTMSVCMQSRATGVRKLNETRRFVCKGDLKPLFSNGLEGNGDIFEVNCIDDCWHAISE